VLVLAGDVGRPDRRGYRDFLHYCSQRWEKVFVVAGNHEFYNTDNHARATYRFKKEVTKPAPVGELFNPLTESARGIRETVAERLQRCEAIASTFHNVEFLNRRAVDWAGVRWLGATLWSDVRTPIGEDADSVHMINDFHMICPVRGLDGSPIPLTTHDVVGWHMEDREWLRSQIRVCEEEEQPVVVITHHLPTYDMIASKWQGSPLNRYFATGLDYLIRPPVRAWIAGHTHTAVTVHKEGVACLTNPLGYPGEAETGFCREIFVVITTGAVGPVRPVMPTMPEEKVEMM
jgi:predicted phosphodiesterase